jgi:starch phosphorylase
MLKPSSFKPNSYEPTPATGLVAYFSMEIAINPRMPTYSGGLGMLAGDTLRSAADLGTPMVAFTLAHRKGYFRQMLDAEGIQTEDAQPWRIEDFCTEEAPRVTVTVENRVVALRAWRYEVVGRSGHILPIYLLDADLAENSDWDRRLTDHLYGGDANYRLQQEILLGMGGVRMAHALGLPLNVFHMNEGHAALLTLALLEAQLGGGPLGQVTETDIEAVRRKCVFTTHTPVPAGHDRFSLEQARRILGAERTERLESMGCCHEGLLNMTYVALRFSRYCNGVALKHGEVSQAMFPEYKVDAITNGVHGPTWVSEPFADLFDRHIPSWRRDHLYLRNAIAIPADELLEAHARTKETLLAEVASRTGLVLNPKVLTLGFARRAATYKRANLLFHDPERLQRIAQAAGGLQILYAGKAHPQDEPGKALIHGVIERAKQYSGTDLRVVYLENYDWNLGAALTAGVDVWVNTPRRPYEASGTSGMKAAMNGVPSLSILDGWWIEGCIEGVTGWAIEDGVDDAAEAESLYAKLEDAVTPSFADQGRWARVMQTTIAHNGSFFNTNRMVKQYIRNAYYPYDLVAAPSMVAEAVSTN